MSVPSGFGGGVAMWAVGLCVLGVPHQLPPPLPSSALPVELVGVVVDAKAPFNSICLIRCTYPAARVGTFGPGERACDLAEVKEIGQDAVIINNLLTNRLERLTFPTTRVLGAAQPPAEARLPADAQVPVPRPVLKESPNLVTVELPESTVRHYLANLPEFLDSALATPRYRDTGNGPQSIEGFEIDRIKPASVVEQMGLKNGDVILELNGQPLDSLASVIRLFGQAQGMTQSRMTVLRNGQRLTFVLNRK
jgi:type II secretory pathway component PulC